MNNINRIAIVFFISFTSSIAAQTPGLIYKSSSTTFGKSVLDPNGDGFASLTTAGFSGGIDYGSASELNMVALPVMENEPVADLSTGSSGGHTDMVTNAISSKQSCYVLLKTVGGVQYFIMRFRLGGASTATKGYSILLDTDGIFGSQYSAINPGFEREIVLETGNRVAIYSHNAGGATLTSFYNIDEYQQRVIAASTVSGNTDYFYDFFVPYTAIDATDPVRIVAATITSAQSGISGTISDFNGVDDIKYGNDKTALFNALINSFPAVSLINLTDSYVFPGVKTATPVITSNLNTSSTSITGTSTEANGTVITIYKNGVSIGTTTVTNNTWTIAYSVFAVGDIITATALATDKSVSSVSNSKDVTGVQSCSFNAPVITGRSSTSINGTWSGSITPNGSNVKIILSEQTANNTFVALSAATATFVAASGLWTISTGYSQNDFNNANFLAQAYPVSNSTCISAYSNVSIKNSGSAANIGYVTPPPTITTTPLYASASATSITVANNGTTNPAQAYLKLYVNGQLVSTSPTAIAINGTYTFSYSGLIEGDIVEARAQGTPTNYWLSNLSTSVTVIGSNVQSNPPVINGTYIAGSGQTVSGTSTEPAGTVIYLRKTVGGVTTVIGTTTVTAFGTWSVTGLTLTTADVLNATAKASGEIESANSNSITVAAGKPAAPVVTGPIYASSTTTSISGTSGQGIVTIYVDGSPIGTVVLASPGNWTLPISYSEIYKGAVIYATNTVSGISSVNSDSVTVLGPDNFLISNYNGSAIPTQIAGIPFLIDVTARDNLNATYTNYTGNNMFNSTLDVSSGAGPSTSFIAGFLNDYSITLTKAGTNNLNTSGVNDPTVLGAASVTVVANTATKLIVSTPASEGTLYNTTFTTQPVVSVTDAYRNIKLTDNTTTITASIFSGTGNLTGTVSKTVVNGMATFTNLGIDYPGTFILKFTPDNALTPTYDTVTVRGYTWKGATSDDFGTASNWLENVVPGDNAAIEFHSDPTNHCLLDMNRKLSTIINAQPTDHFDINNKTLTFTGAFKFTNGAVIKGDALTSKMIYEGTVEQEILSSSFLNNQLSNLEINNPSNIKLLSDFQISKSLTFTNGKMSAGVYTLIFLDGATHAGAGNHKFIDGKCRKIGNDPFIFPIGRANKYAPCEISAPSSISDYFTCEYFKNAHGNRFSVQSPVVRVSKVEYWNIDRVGTSTVDVSLHYTDGPGSGVGQEAGFGMTEIFVSHYSSSSTKWEKPSGVTTYTGTSTEGVIKMTNVNDFSPFTYGTESGATALPIELSSFSASCEQNGFQVNWSTASEHNSLEYIVEKSRDGYTWNTLETVPAAGNSTQMLHYSVFDSEQIFFDQVYFRLNQIDVDGENEIFGPITANCEINGFIAELFPNPTESETILSISTEKDENVNITINSQMGQSIYTLNSMVKSGNTELTISASLFKSGIYTVCILADGKSTMLKLVVL